MLGALYGELVAPLLHCLLGPLSLGCGLVSPLGFLYASAATYSLATVASTLMLIEPPGIFRFALLARSVLTVFAGCCWSLPALGPKAPYMLGFSCALLSATACAVRPVPLRGKLWTFLSVTDF